MPASRQRRWVRFAVSVPEPSVGALLLGGVGGGVGFWGGGRGGLDDVERGTW